MAMRRVRRRAIVSWVSSGVVHAGAAACALCALTTPAEFTGTESGRVSLTVRWSPPVAEPVLEEVEVEPEPVKSPPQPPPLVPADAPLDKQTPIVNEAQAVVADIVPVGTLPPPDASRAESHPEQKPPPALSPSPPRRRSEAKAPDVVVAAQVPSLPSTQRPGAADQQPRPLANNVPPRYPPEALAAGQGGVVWLRVAIDAEGRAAAVEIERSSGIELLDEAALRGVALWRFRPAQRAGEAVASEVLVPIRFTPRRAG